MITYFVLIAVLTCAQARSTGSLAIRAMSLPDLISASRDMRHVNSAADLAWISSALYCHAPSDYRAFATKHTDPLVDLFGASPKTATKGRYDRAGEGAWRAAMMVMRGVGCGEREHVVKALVEAVRALVEERLPGEVIEDINQLLEKSAFDIQKFEKKGANGEEWNFNGNSVTADGDHLLVTGRNRYVFLLRGWETTLVMLKSQVAKQRRVEYKPDDALIFCDTLPSLTRSHHARLLEDVNALSLLRSHDCAIYRP